MESKLKELKAQLTGDIFQDGEIMDEILKLEIELGIIKPKQEGSDYECEGCGA